MGENTRIEPAAALLRRALGQLARWQQWYGDADLRLHGELPLPPSGDVRLAEDIDEFLARRRLFEITAKKDGEPQHGVDCPKIVHRSDGALHAADDDGPYGVDGVIYCGRCHFVLGSGEGAR